MSVDTRIAIARFLASMPARVEASLLDPSLRVALKSLEASHENPHYY
jgi:hypothetical protein